jgi:hypothetical protein
MAIQSITIAKLPEVGFSRKIFITFKEIRVTSSKKATIPASYGKSGESGANAGAASTSTGNTPPSSSGSSSSSGGSKSSIAYSLAQSAGLLK